MREDQVPFNWRTSHEPTMNMLGDLGPLTTTTTTTITNINNASRAHELTNIAHNEENVLHGIFRVLSDIELHGSESTSYSSGQTPPTTATVNESLVEVDRLPESSLKVGELENKSLQQIDHVVHQLDPSKGKEVGSSNIHSESKRKHIAKKRSASEYRRRARIHAKITTLQRLIPGSFKRDQASILDDAIKHMKFLQHQVDMMSMMTRPAFGGSGGQLPMSPSPAPPYALMVPTAATTTPTVLPVPVSIPNQPPTQLQHQLSVVSVVCPPLHFATNPRLSSPPLVRPRTRPPSGSSSSRDSNSHCPLSSQ